MKSLGDGHGKYGNPENYKAYVIFAYVAYNSFSEVELKSVNCANTTGILNTLTNLSARSSK